MPPKFKKRSRSFPTHKKFKNLFDSTEKSIWEKMKTLRKERGLTQKQWSELLGVKNSYVMGYESGRYNPSLALMVVVCDWLEISLDWLTGRSEVRFKNLTYKYKPATGLDYEKITEEVSGTVFQNLRSLREENGHTQYSWAEAVGLTKDYIHTLESVLKTIPPISVQVAILNFTGTSLDWLFGRTEVTALV